MSDQDRYASPRAVEQAIKDAAKTAHEADPARLVDDLIRQAHYDRFLCRVFSQGDNSEWVLKGGSAMLARIPNARRTIDADLFRSGYDKDKALTELRRMINIDLGDFFRFVYRSHRPILADDIQPYADGYRVTFDAFLGVTQLDPINVDLSAHEGATDNITATEPANRLLLPKLVGVPYRLYPIANQVADKVCATLATYGGKPSSREKDAVDLVVIAITQVVEADALTEAIRLECRKRHLLFPSRFRIPTHWGTSYAKHARHTPAEPYNITAVQALMDVFIGSILAGTATGTWDPTTKIWA